MADNQTCMKILNIYYGNNFDILNYLHIRFTNRDTWITQERNLFQLLQIMQITHLQYMFIILLMIQSSAEIETAINIAHVKKKKRKKKRKEKKKANSIACS